MIYGKHLMYFLSLKFSKHAANIPDRPALSLYISHTDFDSGVLTAASKIEKK